MSALTYEPKTLVRWQDLATLQTALTDLFRHAKSCQPCGLLWRMIPDTLSLEQLRELPAITQGWCVQGKEIYVKRISAAAETAIKEIL